MMNCSERVCFGLSVDSVLSQEIFPLHLFNVVMKVGLMWTSECMAVKTT